MDTWPETCCNGHPIDLFMVPHHYETLAGMPIHQCSKSCEMGAGGNLEGAMICYGTLTKHETKIMRLRLTFNENMRFYKGRKLWTYWKIGKATFMTGANLTELLDKMMGFRRTH
jgi:hypothetical protein